MRRLALAVAVCALSAAPLEAQLIRNLEVGAGVMSARFRGTQQGGGTSLSGVAGLGEARLRLGFVSVSGWYVQGRLAPDTGVGATGDLVEAGALLEVHPKSWATLAAGPHLRAYVLPSGTERWVFMELHGGVDGAIVSDVVRAHVDMWLALSSSVTPGGGSGARGGAAGLTARLPRSSVWVRLDYAVDHVSLNAGGAETMDAVRLTLGWGGR